MEIPMVIHVTPEIEADIWQRVESGEYADESELLRTALRMLNVRERRLQEIRASLAEGIASIERGEGIELTAELMDEIEREVEERVRRGDTPSLMLPVAAPFSASRPVTILPTCCSSLNSYGAGISGGSTDVFF
jgi:putative addiction module CopG family antidote